MVQKDVDRDTRYCVFGSKPWLPNSPSRKLIMRVIEQETERFKLKSLPTEQLSVFLISAVMKGWG